LALIAVGMLDVADVACCWFPEFDLSGGAAHPTRTSLRV